MKLHFDRHVNLRRLLADIGLYNRWVLDSDLCDPRNYFPRNVNGIITPCRAPFTTPCRAPLKRDFGPARVFKPYVNL